MTQKQQNQSDFANLDEVKKLIVVNEQIHHNWMSNEPLNKGVEEYAKSNPEDYQRLIEAYNRMNKALGNENSSRCCGGGCGCHGE